MPNTQIKANWKSEPLNPIWWRVRYVDASGGKQSIPGFVDAQSARDYAALMAAERRRGVWIDPAAARVTVAE